MNLVGLFLGLVSSASLFASEGTVLVTDGSLASGLGKIGAALAIAIGVLGAARGQGQAASAALEGLARNPSSRAEVFVPLILSLAFIELQALLCFVIALNLAG